MTHCMPLSIARISLTNFRNYEAFNLETTPDPVIITGRNGLGKTNLLEAISLLVPGKGLRNARISEFERHTSNATHKPWSVFAKIRTPSGEVSIGTGRDPTKESDKRIINIDGEKKRGQAELTKHFAVCSLTPQMDQTFADGTTSRRNYLDKLTNIFHADHVKHISIYEHAKSERKKLLSSYRADETWLTTLEQRMAEQAVAIAAARMETIAHLQKAVNERNSIFPKAIMAVNGIVEEALRIMPAIEAENTFQEKLAMSREQDTQTGRTNVGTHRSDFIVLHADKQLPAELCSTGEQKALLLSITLATARAKSSWTGSTPVLLLDEVVAHLDPSKRVALFDELDALSAQSWLTGTDPNFFKDFNGKVQTITIENTMAMG